MKKSNNGNQVHTIIYTMTKKLVFPIMILSDDPIFNAFD